MAAGLTEKQKRFCDEYLIDLNGTRAYRAAYPAVKQDYTAAQNASRMLRNAKVAKYIRERIEARQRRTEITQDRVIRELAAIAFTDTTDIVSYERGMILIRDTSELTEDQRKAVAGYKHNQWGDEVKVYDRVRALELLGRHLGLFDQRKDDLDREEQKARIEKLRSETRTADTDGEGGVIFIPTMADRPEPPEDDDE